MTRELKESEIAIAYAAASTSTKPISPLYDKSKKGRHALKTE
jgi:hypothetical protein